MTSLSVDMNLWTWRDLPKLMLSSTSTSGSSSEEGLDSISMLLLRIRRKTEKWGCENNAYNAKINSKVSLCALFSWVRLADVSFCFVPLMRVRKKGFCDFCWLVKCWNKQTIWFKRDSASWQVHSFSPVTFCSSPFWALISKIKKGG